MEIGVLGSQNMLETWYAFGAHGGQKARCVFEDADAKAALTLQQ
jgi:hypothetical protein